VAGHAACIVTLPAEITKTGTGRLPARGVSAQAGAAQRAGLSDWAPGAAGELSVAVAQGVRCC
jgi:hypothetical protein